MEVLIALIVIAVIAAIVLAVMLPRMRAAKHEREVRQARVRAAEEHRSVADDRARRAEAAETEARRARAEAEMHQEEARLAEMGHRDDRLFDREDRSLRNGHDDRHGRDELVEEREVVRDRPLDGR